jgi:hypothetical protein
MERLQQSFGGEEVAIVSARRCLQGVRGHDFVLVHNQLQQVFVEGYRTLDLTIVRRVCRSSVSVLCACVRHNPAV